MVNLRVLNFKEGGNMKKSLLTLVAILALVFSGCAEKKPEAQTSNGDVVVEEEVASSEPATDLSQLLQDLKSKLGVVYFNFDKFDLRSDMQTVVNTDATLLNATDTSSVVIKLEGNCDEWGSDEYNMALGLKRAQTVKNALVAEGVNADRISTVSYGKNNPVCSAQTKACWANNRRVDFALQ